jgi:glucose-1-phosphate adenylyltransferase
MPNVRVGRNCRISRAILDEGCEIPDGMCIGQDPEADRLRFHITERGVVLVTPDMLELKDVSTESAGELPRADLRSNG